MKKDEKFPEGCYSPRVGLCRCGGRKPVPDPLALAVCIAAGVRLQPLDARRQRSAARGCIGRCEVRVRAPPGPSQWVGAGLRAELLEADGLQDTVCEVHSGSRAPPILQSCSHATPWKAMSAAMGHSGERPRSLSQGLQCNAYHETGGRTLPQPISREHPGNEFLNPLIFLFSNFRSKKFAVKNS